MAILNFGSISNKSFAHPYVARNVGQKFQKKLISNFFFCAHQKKGTPDRILARLKSPFPYRRRIKKAQLIIVQFHTVCRPLNVCQNETVLMQLSTLADVGPTLTSCMCAMPVFHLAISNMVLRHAAFCERHVALHECHVALHESHELNCQVIFNSTRPL